MSFCYLIYGLRLRVNRPLISAKEFTKRVCDLDVDLSNSVPGEILAISTWLRTYPELEDKFSLQVARSAGWVKLSFPRSSEAVLNFFIRADGKQIFSQKSDSIPDLDLEPFLLGPVLGAVQRLLGRTCLHASVLSYRGKTFALTGEKRAGKSSTSAALLEAGASLVADDVAVLDMSGPNPRVESAYPGVRLMPNVLNQLGYSADSFPHLISVGEKRFVRLDNKQVSWQFDDSGPELNAVFSLLQRDPDLKSASIKTLSTAEALMILAPHSYAYFMFDQTELKREFPLMAKFVRSIPVKSIQCPDDIRCLNAIASKILEQVSHNVEGAGVCRPT